MEHTNYTFTLEARNVPGMLVRITQVFARRGCNIQSLNVRPYTNNQWPIIDVEAYDIIDPHQMQYQLEKLVDVNYVNVRQHTLHKG